PARRHTASQPVRIPRRTSVIHLDVLVQNSHATHAILHQDPTETRRSERDRIAPEQRHRDEQYEQQRDRRQHQNGNTRQDFNQLLTPPDHWWKFYHARPHVRTRDIDPAWREGHSHTSDT